MLKNFRWTPPAEFPEEAWDGVKKIAGEISRDANNNTDAPAGFTYEDMGSGKDRVIRLGPVGAAAYPIEFGTRAIPARRPFKRAADKHREG